MAKAFGLNQGGGALVSEVTAGSPAAKAGIERGDIILALNGKTVSGPDDLSVYISEMAPGSTVHLKIARNGQTREVTATLSELTEKPEESARGIGNTSAQRGLQVENLTPSIARHLGVPATTVGVVVTAVDSSSATAAANIERGDVIEEVNRKPVRNVADYGRALAGAYNQTILLLLNRAGAARFIVVSPE
jgi:serine protease Do